MLSIIISTYNRCDNLKDMLKSLLEQDCLEQCDYEVIVVDNNSTDRTKEVTESFKEPFGGRLRYYFEPRQGINFARNTGIKASQGDLVAFTDDDLLIDKRWMYSICNLDKEIDFDAVGGRVLPAYPSHVPRWVKRNQELLSGPIVSHDYGEELKPYQKDMFPFIGANLVVKRKLLDEFGLFRTDLGPGQGTMGDDTELFVRLKQANKRIYYCGKALAWHKVEDKRMSLKYIAQWQMHYGRFAAREDEPQIKEEAQYVFGVPRYLIGNLVKNIIKLFLNVFNEKSFLTCWNKFFREMGMMFELKAIHAETLKGRNKV